MLKPVNLIRDAASHGPFLTDRGEGVGDALQARAHGRPRAALPAETMARGQLTGPLAALDKGSRGQAGGWAGRQPQSHHVLRFGVSFTGLTAGTTQPVSVQVRPWTTVLLPVCAGQRGHCHDGVCRHPTQPPQHTDTKRAAGACGSQVPSPAAPSRAGRPRTTPPWPTCLPPLGASPIPEACSLGQKHPL